MPSTSRGRPRLAAREAAAQGSGAERLRHRIAWLLRVNRLYGPDGTWANGEAFSAAFAGGCHPDPVSESKVSRWETGLTDVPRRAVRRYEQILGLPRWSLVSTVDLVSRYVSPPAVRRPPGRGGLRASEDHALEDFLEQADAPGLLTAADWYEATGWFASLPGLLLRRGEWDSVCHRLLLETVAADGEAWKPRFEAFCRLLQHPSAQRFAVAACADWATCADNRVFVETVSLLDECRHPDAAAAILRQLTSPTNDDAFAGALLACVRKVTNAHFSPAQLSTITRVALDVVTDTSPGHADARAHARAVLAHLPPDARARAGWPAQRPEAAPPDRPGPARGSLGPLMVARSISLLPREVSRFADHVLPALVSELLDAPVADTRLYAAFLIRATPYRDPMASSLAWGLGHAPHGSHAPLMTVRVLEALRVLGGADQRVVAERCTDPAQPFPVQDAAFRALGHIGGASDPAFWRNTLLRHSPLARAGHPGSSRLLDHAVYAISMQRDVAELRRIAADGSLARSARTSARWWLDLPGHMLASAER